MGNEQIYPNVFTLTDNPPSVSVDRRKFPLVYGEWTSWHPEGFRFRTYAYDGVEAHISDGADIEIQDGGHTPVQAFVTKRNGDVEFYWEQPLAGDLTLLTLSQDGKVHVAHFNEKILTKEMMTIQPGMIMCWFAGRTETGVSHIQESEYPGFDENDLVTVPNRSSEVAGITIPIEFWDAFDQLETKRKLGAPIEFDGDGKYTEAYIQWWAKITNNEEKIDKIRHSISFGTQLELQNYRCEIEDIIESTIIPIVQINSDLDDNSEEKQNFVSRMKRLKNVYKILGGINPDDVDAWVTMAESSDWTLEFVKKILQGFLEITPKKNYSQE